VIKKEITINDTEIKIIQGDISMEQVDVIVNAANTKLAHGGGIAAAIISRAGVEVQKESTAYVKANGDVPPGEVVVTEPGKLKCKKLFHAVGPFFQDGANGEHEILKELLIKVFSTAEEMDFTTISIPAIATGILNFPKEMFAIHLFDTINQYLTENPDTGIREIRLTNVDMPTTTYLSREFNKRFPEDKHGKKLELRPQDSEAESFSNRA
jgi:O-acetyl-ADP-ribose deacetylase (regulator of RNase III)